MAETVENLDFVETIKHAFSIARAPSLEEVEFLRWLAANPGGSYKDARRFHGKGDLGLLIGHLVYDRYGCFRRYMKPGEDQSSVLIAKDRTGESVRYTLRPEAVVALTEIGVI